MDLPARVIVFCPTLEMKNKPGRLMAISPHGYYECRMDMAAGNHTVYVPISGTAVIFTEPNTIGQVPPDVERYG